MKSHRKVASMRLPVVALVTLLSAFLLVAPTSILPAAASDGSSGGSGMTCTPIIIIQWGWVSIGFGFFGDIWAWLPTPVLTAYCTGGQSSGGYV